MKNQQILILILLLMCSIGAQAMTLFPTETTILTVDENSTISYGSITPLVSDFNYLQDYNHIANNGNLSSVPSYCEDICIIPPPIPTPVPEPSAMLSLGMFLFGSLVGLRKKCW